MAVKGEGRGGKDSEQTALLSRRSTMGCESEEREERGARERDRYAEKRSVCGGIFFFKCQKTEKAQECSHYLSFCGFNVNIWL